ncbi:MAG: hypothetical protein HC854_14195 [Flavobacterium sp.]|nr:hypothetical protein [Flavobacterium sp.]
MTIKSIFILKNIEYPLKKPIKIDFIKQDVEEKFTKWFGYKTYLKHANYIIESNYETLMLVAKENNNSFKPIKQNIEEQYIEIAE